MTNQIIIDTSEVAEMVGFDEDEAPRENLEVTQKSDPEAKIEFHVQMRSWTITDMEQLVIEAAARQLVGRNASEGELAKAVQDAAIRQITAKADAKMATVSEQIIDQPVMAGPGSKEPVTMREMIGLYAKEYLTEIVGPDGKISTDYYGRQSGKARMVWIVERALDAKFKDEITKATNAAIREIQTEIRAQHIAVVQAETGRIRAAIAAATSAA
jgi:hypothetical protein